MKLAIKIIVVLFLFVYQSGRFNILSQVKMENSRDRNPVVAGRFYEGDKHTLEAEVKGYLTPQSRDGYMNDLLALIVPHAGYVFSGSIAGMGYKVLNPAKKINTIFLIGSSHHLHFEGASIYNVGDYITPLGHVTVDKKIANDLIVSSRNFSFNADAHNREHSLEVQLPFLQVQLNKPFKIVPIVLGTQDPYVCKQLAKDLKKYFVPGNLFVISSDFSHYPNYETAVKVDKNTADAIMSKNPEKLLKAVMEVRRMNDADLLTALCGWTSVLTLMYITQDDNSVDYKHLGYRNSGDVSFGDKNRVVGYNAIAVTKDNEFTLNAEQKELLLALSHDELNRVVGSVKTVDLPDEKVLDEKLGAHAGAFVSLYNKGKLRGCIGRFISNQPLWKTVQDMTKAAATQDTRFYPVKKDELESIKIEISVLTPLKSVSDISEIELGRHGIYIKKGVHVGTFLPQVADKTGWSLDEFLGHCSRDKAHIGWDGWRDAELFTYEAIVFSD